MPENVYNEPYQPVTFDAIKIGLASPEKIRQWSHGEVKKPETINYRTLKPEKDGLYCEKIFGPSKDWECHCGKYKKIRYRGVVCDRCGVEVTKASVRRERMGHIELATPIAHIWYFKGVPCRMGLILDIPVKKLESVLYFASYIVTDPGNTPLHLNDTLSENEYQKAVKEYGEDSFKAGMGAEAIQELLKAIDLDETAASLAKELEESTGQKRAKIIKRLEVVEAFRASGNRPEWMVLNVIPVIPPDIRPMVQLDGGRFATSDLNDLYRRIINRNNRLKKLLEQRTPNIIIKNEKRMLQEAVDALIDNGRHGRPVTGPGNRALKSLSDMLKGKQGRFRQNLLGKRVDYSGRSVIVVGPELKIYQCGLPKEMAIELFKPFVMKELTQRGKANNIKSAKKMVDRLQNEVWDVLEDVIKEHPVMLNRAPTLHRLGIQAFEPVLVEGKAIKLHPLVCMAFNADFDGDQMAVHVPLFVEAQAECRFILLSPNNLLKPSDGGPVAVPTQDMVLGIYYLTLLKPDDKGAGKAFRSTNEALLAYENKLITLQAPIKVRMTGEVNGETRSQMIETTLGRLLFNEGLPQDLGYVDRTDPEKVILPEIDFLVKKKQLKDIIDRCINIHGLTRTAEVLDYIKATGYKYSTISAISVSVSDMTVPAQKQQYIKEAEAKIEKITRNYHRGLSTDAERYRDVIQTWNDCDDKVRDALLSGLDKYNNIFMMADSGARGSNQQIKQLAGMRGLMADTQGHTIELPIKSNFREGLDVLEYFISAHGARKGLSDTALRTADSGYLTRRLVDVSQDLIIREQDCCEGMDRIPGMEVSALMDGKELIESLEERISGRYAAEDVCDPNTQEIIVKADHMITPKRAKMIAAAGITGVKVRTALSCRSHVGICAKCYGQNLATGQPVQVGEAVGIIAAQSIGEPGTQLTMRTFHTGGVAGGDITQGLPRVEELFEARKPKGEAIIAEIAGTVAIHETKKKREVTITSEDGDSKTVTIPWNKQLKVFDGDQVSAADQLTDGSVNPNDILRIKGVRAAQDYMIREVQRVYRLQGVEINDKHVEVIVRQMLKKVRIEESGATEYLPGQLVDVLDFEELNEYLEEDGEEPAKGTRIMLGITKASLATGSFLSAASFQETTKVLTEAAIKGKVDPLIGLKENVILGKLIPAGTGMRRYRATRLSTDDFVPQRDEVSEDEFSGTGYEPQIQEEEFTDSPEAEVTAAEGYETEDFSEEGTEE
ncbi:MAG: DNA-directed RNA polymerase subunit beta' [Lachnospiraceae bacterium]|nr:DNA-directed RNA polymerase subunit beta' [Lachnospiraceae bacterium]